MSVRLRVRDEGEGGLCQKCKFSTKVQGRNRRGAAVTRFKCGALHYEGVWLDMVVERCGSFELVGTPSLYDMKESAWLLLNERTKKMGFVPPDKIDKSLRQRILDTVDDPGNNK